MKIQREKHSLQNSYLRSIALRKVNIKKICPRPNYTCPKEWLFYNRVKIKPEHIPLVILLEKTRKITINLLAEYVNLSEIKNGIFRMSNCYSIQEFEQCEVMSLPFASFIKYIRLKLLWCEHINSVTYRNIFIKDFYKTFRRFLKKNLSFLLRHDLQRIEIVTSTGRKSLYNLAYNLDNTGFQLEKIFIRYIKKMNKYISNMIQDLALDSGDLKKVGLSRLMKKGEQALKSKIRRLKRIARIKIKDFEHNDSDKNTSVLEENNIVNSSAVEYNLIKNNLTNFYDMNSEFDDEKQKTEIGSKYLDAIGDDMNIFENEQDFEQTTKNLLTKIFTSTSKINDENFSDFIYDITKATPILSEVFITPEVQGEYVETSTNLWISFFAVMICLIAIFRLRVMKLINFNGF